MTPPLHGTNTTWGWVTISHTQSPAKGPQAMINPAAVVAISWRRKLVWLVLLILINSNPGQLLVYHCYCLVHAVRLYTSGAGAVRLYTCTVHAVQLEASGADAVRLFIISSMVGGSHLKYLECQKFKILFARYKKVFTNLVQNMLKFGFHCYKYLHWNYFNWSINPYFVRFDALFFIIFKEAVW